MAPQDGSDVGFTGARFGRGGDREGPVAGRERLGRGDDTVSMPVVVPAEPPPAREPAVWREPVPDPGATSVVRPYVLTRGRTRSTVELAIEALVSVVPAVRGDLTPHPEIVEICREPRSVAEVAALRGVPLGVARVLLGDLVASGAVVVHRTADAGGPDRALMERVLGGLRRL